MVIMSVDYGDARTGIAVCDRLETLAYPVEVISGAYAPKVAERIQEIVKQYKPELIVVGYPKNMDASEGFRAEKCAKFADLIGEVTKIPVALWDERLTTVSAYNLLNDADTHGKKRKKVIDAVAATVILQDFLDYRKNTAAQK